MAKTVYRYIYDDLRDPSNNCIYSTMVQVSDKCGIAYRTLQDIFYKSNVYYDRQGMFKIEKRPHYTAQSKNRKR
jgi:hypothetical protein